MKSLRPFLFVQWADGRVTAEFPATVVGVVPLLKTAMKQASL